MLQNLLENSEFDGLKHFLDKVSQYPVIVLGAVFVFSGKCNISDG